MKTTTVTIRPPSENYRYQPDEHELHYSSVLGWTVSRIGEDCAMQLTDEEGELTLRYWQMVEKFRRHFPDIDLRAIKCAAH